VFAYLKTPLWDRVDDEAKAAFAELAEALGAQVIEVALPEAAQPAWDWHRTVMAAEMAANFDTEWERGRERLSEELRSLLAHGREVRALDYQQALARGPALADGFAELFERCDAILTPAAPGPAPRGLAATGDPSFCTLWTYCGMPAVSLPLMKASSGLPLGVQLVGARGADARLLRTARWLTARVEGETT